MSAVLGSLGTAAALGFAVALVVMGFRGLYRPDRADPGRLAVPAVGLLASSVLAMFSLELALLTNDFRVDYVANNSTTSTPLLYKFASAWGALEGSLVLWGLVLAVFTFFIWRSMKRRAGSDPLWAGALGVMGLISAFFFFMMVTVSNPFEVCTATGGFGCAEATPWPFASTVDPAQGLGPNPLLQNHPLMAAHPPTLYVGYVGMAAPFAFAMAALLIGESGDRWLRVTRNWTRIAWIFLTGGIVLGGLWSYEVLGWGGYWAWDPVENASFMPWLAATLFIHTAALQIRRGVLQAWNYGAVIATFSLTILGTFLTRSGIINSVHSFTQSPIGPVLLWFLMLVLVAGFGVYAWRIDLIGSGRRLDSLFSREGMILVNNLLLGVFAFVVLVGTIYPMFVEWFTGDQVGVGRPFFDRMAIPISLVLLGAMAVGPFFPYRRAEPRIVWERIRTPLRVGLGAAAATALFWDRTGWILVTMLLSVFVVSAAVRNLWVSARSRAAKQNTSTASAAFRLIRRDAGFWGGQLAHIGIAVLALGIAISANQSKETVVDLAPGETIEFAGMDLTLDSTFAREEPHRVSFGGVLELRRGDRTLGVLEPKLNTYNVREQTIASPAVHTGLRGDFYLSLKAIDEAGVTVEVFWFPFIWFIWVGGFLSVAGATWAWLARSPRRARVREQEAADA